MTQTKAVALVSGGLDSMLAVRLVQEQGVHVEGINFYTGFCVEGHTSAIRKRQQGRIKRNNALWVAETLGIKLHIVDIAQEYKDAVVLNPRYGYGKNLNPCLDCKIYMVDKALEWADARDFDFIITGEVIGQRPKSQRAATMPLIASESGAGDRLLRPLCAKLLPETLPEREGWVDRSKLLGLSGRNRKPQMALAAEFGIEDYAQPAGGCCFLTDAAYSSKLQDLWKARGQRDYELDDIMLLKVGRHIRPKPHFKLIVGREEGENNFLEGYRRQFIALHPLSHTGPLVLVDGEVDESDLELAAGIAARYGKGASAEQVTLQMERPDGEGRVLSVRPLARNEIPDAWYV